MALALIPPIGTTGIFTLSAPFTTKLQVATSYRCEAIQRFSELLEAGAEPFEEFYQVNGLTQEKYEQDLANNVCIVSLVSNTGHWVRVPSSYIVAFPDIGGIAYSVMVLGLEIGAIPNYLDLTGLKSVLAQVCQDTLGKRPEVKEVIISAVEKISQSDHDTLENARQQAITNSQTDRAKLLALQKQYAALLLEHQQLEAWVKNNYVP